MIDIEQIKSALNWQGVFPGRDCPVIKFDENDAGLIQGLDSNDDCFYLKFPEFRDRLISFLVTNNRTVCQYWVLNQRLHRTGGPAKVWNSGNCSHSVWMQNGLKHNLNGPAEISITGHTILTENVHPRTQEVLPSEYIIETWDNMETHGFINGLEAQYPTQHSANCQNGIRLFRETNGEQVLCDYMDHPAFEAERVFANWTREGRMTDVDHFRIRLLRLYEYYRNYQMGDPKSHGCKNIENMCWIINGEVVETGLEARQQIHVDLFPEWNIWEGPFFPNEQEEIFAMQEAIK